MKNLEVRIKGPGPGRESAVRALNALGIKIIIDLRRDAGAAQRLPSAEAPPHLERAERMVGRSGNAVELRRTTVARYLGPKGKLSRREGTDLFLKSARRSLDDKCKLDAKPGQHGRTSRRAHVRLRHAAAREAEGQAHVRRARAPVPPLLRGGRAPQGQHRREPAAAARVAPRQRRLPHGLRLARAPKRASSCRTTAILVNGKRVNIPSYLVAPGDVGRGAREVRRTSCASRLRSSSPSRSGFPTGSKSTPRS